MDRIPFQDGTKISSAKVTIDGVDYPVTPARYTGATPLSSVVMNAMQDNIEDAIDQNAINIGGEEYDETATYEEGDIVKYEGQLYICIEAIDTPEEWDSTKWDATDVLSSAGGNEVTIGTSADITGKTKIFIDETEGTDAYSEVVNSLSGDEIAKAPSVHAVNGTLDDINEALDDINTNIDNLLDYSPKIYNVTNNKTIRIRTNNYATFRMWGIYNATQFAGYFTTTTNSVVNHLLYGTPSINFTHSDGVTTFTTPSNTDLNIELTPKMKVLSIS